MTKRLNAAITRDGEFYVARCLELGVVSQGKSIEEARANHREAVELYIESFGADDLPDSEGEIVFYPLEAAASA